IINKIIYKQEKAGKPVKFYPARLANALANILCYQIDEIEQLNLHRQTIAKIYNQQLNNQQINFPWQDNQIDLENCTCLRYPVLLKKTKALLIYAKKQGIMLGDWYNAPLAPADSRLDKTGYNIGQCPKAELLASQSVNLPTDRQISMKDAKKIIKSINLF
ncbi:DegT/DnrJ/EryC1/StrS family aminotransferase, partial [Patescibacteria group bacterium]|nr:DegT/DnrJ/EryC1/StrS family aminotransferase [Patescibacteria group bacterium]MBU2008155.1 DegT/DnrJ/EryC1/StrS family aminotransferase [Patescibacteria group bacterium]